MIRSCEQAREIVNGYCSGASEQDPEDIRMAFFHIYYCWNRDNKCGGLWFQLNKKEIDPDIRSLLEKWTDKPLAGFTVLGGGQQGVDGIVDN